MNTTTPDTDTASASLTFVMVEESDTMPIDVDAKQTPTSASSVHYLLLNRDHAGADGWPVIVGAVTFEAVQRRIEALRPGPTR